MRATLRFLIGANEVDCLLNRAQVFLLLVGNLNLEGIFEGHHELNGVEAVGAEIFDEGSFILDVRFILAELFSDNLCASACFYILC